MRPRHLLHSSLSCQAPHIAPFPGLNSGELVQFLAWIAVLWEKGHPEKTQDAGYYSHPHFGERASTHPEAAAVPASSVPLPAFSPRASALSVAGAEAAVPA